MNKIVTNAVLAVVIPALFSGCSTPILKSTRNEIAANETSANESLKKQNQINEKANDLIEKVDGAYIPLVAIEDNESSNPSLNRIITKNKKYANLQAAIQDIGDTAGMAITISPDALEYISSRNAKDKTTQVPQGSVIVPQGQPGMQQPAQSQSINFTYEGKVSGAIDLLAARNGVSWEPAGNGARLFLYKTKSFELFAIPGEANGSNSISTTGGSSSGGSAGGSSGGSGSTSSVSGSSSQSTATNYKLSIWTSIEAVIKNMLSSGGRMAMSPSLGSVVVTDTPRVLNEISEYLAPLNAQMRKQMWVNVKVLTVTQTDADQYGLNWTAVYTKLNKLGYTLTNNNTAVTTSGASAAVISVPAGASGSNAEWVGSSAMIQALTTQGAVQQLTSSSLPALNNQPAPLLVGNQKSILQSSSSTAGSVGVQPTVTLTPGQVNTGFALSVVPHITETGDVYLQCTTDISYLNGIGTVTSGTSSIQTPDVDTRSFIARVRVKLGETIVLAGFEQMNLNALSNGIGSADFIAAGGGMSKNKNKTKIVVLLQPQMMD